MKYAKKYLGQNFLRSRAVLEDILEAAELTGKDTVVEIGPGEGFLTEGLLEKAGRVIAIEKDAELTALLKEKFAKEIKYKKLILINDDIRNFNFSSWKLKAGSWKLVANIPYYITGEILRFFLQSKFQPSLTVLMLQKEVAERIVARNGKESILSISVKAYGNPKIVRQVPKGNFSPMPKVDSAVIKIENISKNFFRGFSEKKFFEIVRAGFAHKRKKLISNLSKKFGREKTKNLFKKISIDEKVRAEEISLEKWGSIAK